jgi:prepilin-type N-terminal cleavage/methylation domain-containing protein
MRAHAWNQDGFTLIELMVVVVVFGLLIGISVPAISSYLKSSRLAGATNTLDADFHYARSLANTQRKSYEVIFQGTKYSVAQVSPLVTVLTRQLPAGVSVAATDTATFFAWGLTDPITVTMTQGSKTRVAHLAVNGRIY